MRDTQCDEVTSPRPCHEFLNRRGFHAAAVERDGAIEDASDAEPGDADADDAGEARASRKFVYQITRRRRPPSRESNDGRVAPGQRDPQASGTTQSFVEERVLPNGSGRFLQQPLVPRFELGPSNFSP